MISLMSRREIAINILSGTILLLAFALPVLALVLAGEFLHRMIAPPIETYISSFGFPYDAWDLIVLSALSVWEAVTYIRRRYWMNVFTAGSIVAMAILIWFSKRPFGPSHDRSEVIWPFILLLLLPIQRPFRRWEFVSAGILVSMNIALNTGMFGSSTFAKAVDYGMGLGVMIWFALAARRGWFSPENLSAPSRA